MTSPPRHAVELTEAADADLEAIFDYVAHHRSPAEANRLLDRLEAKCATLSTYPERGSVPAELEPLGDRGYRQLVLPPHRLIYRVIAHTVSITLIADGRRDVGALLQRRLLGG